MKLLIIEDDEEIVEVVTLAIQIRWPDVQIIPTHLGEKGIELVAEERPDLVVLDLGLPDISGYETLKRLRVFSNVPIIILTSRDDETDVIKALEWGADDYISKPFRQMELTSRIQAVLRRAGPSEHEAPEPQPAFRAGKLVIDYNSRAVTYKGQAIKLTPTEYQLLFHLTKNSGRVLTSRTLLSKVWGRAYIDEKEYLKVHISNLRRKLDDDLDAEALIVTERGIGYRFVSPNA